MDERKIISTQEEDLSTLTAISPLDGRYWSKVGSLSNYFSEFSLIKARVKVEIEYYIALCEIPLPQLKDFPIESFIEMRSWYENFSLADAKKIKETEKITNHDVKAVEYYVKEKFDEVHTTCNFLVDIFRNRKNGLHSRNLYTLGSHRKTSITLPFQCCLRMLFKNRLLLL
jgi:hypothetical protein